MSSAAQDHAPFGPLPPEVSGKEEASASNPTHYLPGYICCVHETMSTVAEHIFIGSPGIAEQPLLRQKCEDRLRDIYMSAQQPSSTRGKRRPCIICNLQSRGQSTTPQMMEDGPLICIMGTFGGNVPGDMVYLHFGVPVSPILRELLPGRDAPSEQAYLHTCPKPWPHPKQLVIAFRYRSPSAILGAWPLAPRDSTGHNSDSTNTAEYWLDEENQEWLWNQCQERLNAWNELCRTDPGFAWRCALEYQVSDVTRRCVVTVLTVVLSKTRKQWAVRPRW
ncbi:hypothetical protein C8Q77DRAFT_1065637 [Trametes polyzona]|nr:hypothetical protein C8Q77DRAFT_1065637 [Trametes polyzona]